LANIEGDMLRPIVAASDSSGYPVPEVLQWSTDGRTIFYKAFDSEGRSSIWSITASGGQPRLLMRFDDPSRPSSRPEFATDGKRLYFSIGQRQSDVWTVELVAAR
jgi:Tol biopolymer transport system component